MTTGALASMPATVLRRTRSTARLREPRLTRPQGSHARIRCTAPCALAIRDASLSAPGPRGSGVAEQHDERHRGACADSAHQPAAATRDGKSAHTPRRSRRSRDRNAGRCAPAPHSGDSCRAGRSAPTDPPRPPSPTALDSAGRGRHKGPAHYAYQGAEHRGPGGSTPIKRPGPSSFCPEHNGAVRKRNTRALCGILKTNRMMVFCPACGRSDGAATSPLYGAKT